MEKRKIKKLKEVGRVNTRQMNVRVRVNEKEQERGERNGRRERLDERKTVVKKKASEREQETK